ncbi:hypothetical protein ACNKHW_16055 [Shigella flexneri]
MMGRSLAHIPQRHPDLPYQLQAGQNGLPMTRTAAGRSDPGPFSAEILNGAGQRGTEALRRAGWRGDHRSRVF